MKRKYLHLSGSARLIAFLAILGFTNFPIIRSALFAQTATASSEVITTDALTDGGTVWLSSTDFSSVVAAERVNAAASLALPNLSDADIALFTGYDKMLVSMQSDLAVKMPVESIAEINFKKIKVEATTDPALANLEEAAFTALYATLVTKLIVH